MVAEPNTVRGKLLIGRVLEVYSGQEGRVKYNILKIDYKDCIDTGPIQTAEGFGQ